MQASKGSEAGLLEQYQSHTRFAWVPLKSLFAAPYERPLSMSRVERLLLNWDIRAVGVLYVAERREPDGTESYAILDGRHRKVAAEQRGVVNLPALIYEGLSYADEANLYVAFATVNRQTSMDRYRAKLEAKDPIALDIQALARDEGRVLIGVQYSIGSPGYLNAVFTCEKIYRDFGRETLQGTFRMVRLAWQDRQKAWTDRILWGMAQFLVRYRDHESYDPARLIKQLGALTPEHLISRAHLIANAANFTDSRSTIGLAIVEVYNEGLRTGKLPSWQSRVYTHALGEGLVVLDTES